MRKVFMITAAVVGLGAVSLAASTNAEARFGPSINAAGGSSALPVQYYGRYGYYQPNYGYYQPYYAPRYYAPRYYKPRYYRYY